MEHAENGTLFSALFKIVDKTITNGKLIFNMKLCVLAFIKKIKIGYSEVYYGSYMMIVSMGSKLIKRVDGT